MIKALPDSEFKQRIKRIQEKLIENDYDAYLVHCNEADQANVRYLSDHWPIFETAGVIVPREGEPILLIGPEAEYFAVDRSRIKTIRKMVEYRESAEPDYPDKGGYEQYIVCPFVHTIGLYEAESPFFGPNSDDVLKENMTDCIDSSLWAHPTLHGVRVESGFIITKSGFKPLSLYMDKLIESQMICRWYAVSN